MSTYLATLPLSSTVTAAASDILPPHDKGGTAVKIAYAPGSVPDGRDAPTWAHLVFAMDYKAMAILLGRKGASANQFCPYNEKCSAPSSFESMSTLEITSPPDVSPPSTTRVTLTAQHTLGLAYKQKRGQHLPP
jgi:hypothetical protein